uniref:recombining binding protein suppressor of hairless-like protein isoform X3 n=1 Tax=Doryrhamphus excisus TaxID=161450 RepID=UPI0025ADDF95|nr:recombining binding protein suppressor of hairless-like protein isoform X3 [Doryrhamphus excisus]
MDELGVMEDRCREASKQQLACFQPSSTEAVTHLLDGHVEWDRRTQSTCPSLAASRGGDQCVVILHAKVAQKSYGNEKRFFCPPPCVYIIGHAWRLLYDHLAAGGVDLCGYMCVDASAHTHSDTFKLTFDLLSDRRMFACAKSLFISDQDKRKHFRLLLQIFTQTGSSRQEVGAFHSRLIKVISKPSQKRQSMKNADLCISACSRVALFNRLRSQTVSTRYLAVEGTAFIASARQWTAFTITLVEEPRADRGDFVLSEGLVCYGCVVQLVCTESGVTLPPMVIRKVNKQHAILEVDEPVSQLHKCALEFRDTPHAYLCLSNDAIVVHQAVCSVKDPSRVVLNDGSCWTVIGVEVVDYTFNQEAVCVQTPISPFPVVSSLDVNGGGHVAMLEILGENFGPHLKVCFGNTEAETMFKRFSLQWRPATSASCGHCARVPTPSGWRPLPHILHVHVHARAPGAPPRTWAQDSGKDEGQCGRGGARRRRPAGEHPRGVHQSQLSSFHANVDP